MSRRWVASSRRRRRNVLLLVGLLPSVVALGVALALLVMLFRQASGVAATDRGRHDEARGWFAANRWAATVERWIAPFNEGVASYRDGEFDGALDDFLAALEIAPPEAECLIRHNIALSRERLADTTEADDAALKSYRAARLALSGAGCLQRDLGTFASRVEGLDDEDDEDDEEDEEADGVAGGSFPELTQQVDDRLVDKIEEILAERQQQETALLSAEEREEAERREEVNQDAEQEDQRRQDEAAAPAEPPPGEDPGDRQPDEGGGRSPEDYGW